MTLREILMKTKPRCPVQIIELNEGRTVNAVLIESDPLLNDALRGAYPGKTVLSEDILNKSVYRFGTKMIRNDIGDVVCVALELTILGSNEHLIED